LFHISIHCSKLVIIERIRERGKEKERAIGGKEEKQTNKTRKKGNQEAKRIKIEKEKKNSSSTS
jgi:hypothetical protein